MHLCSAYYAYHHQWVEKSRHRHRDHLATVKLDPALWLLQKIKTTCHENYHMICKTNSISNHKVGLIFFLCLVCLGYAATGSIWTPDHINGCVFIISHDLGNNHDKIFPFNSLFIAPSTHLTCILQCIYPPIHRHLQYIRVHVRHLQETSEGSLRIRDVTQCKQSKATPISHNSKLFIFRPWLIHRCPQFHTFREPGWPNCGGLIS